MRISLNVFLGLLVLPFFSSVCYSQNWQEITATISSGAKSETTKLGIKTNQHKSFDVNFVTLKKLLHASPLRQMSNTTMGSVIKFPDANGTITSYRLQRVINMHPDLAAKYPGIASYAGYDIKNPTNTIRVTETPKGIHARLSSIERTSYITPLTNDRTLYKVYEKNAIIPENEQPHCLVGGKQQISEGFLGNKNTSKASKAITDGKLRTLRMAIVTTAEFSDYYIEKAGVVNGSVQDKKAAVIAGLNVLLNSLNDLYEREFSLNMVLVPENDKVIFLDADTDGLSNGNTSALIDQGNTIMNNEIGFDNFDIGHTMNTGGGGIAYFFTPCGTQAKGRAVSGSSRPEGDSFVFDLWAHEVGHQFTGEHSFNNSCNTNRSNDSAVEPGSGTTIMSYAGICSPNVQPNADHHFHGLSHKQISAYINQRINPSNTCGVTITNNNNNAPVVQPISDYTIPADTPFVLSANATDADNDILLYQFDQMDAEITTAPPEPTAQSGPVFRSVMPTTNPFRYFPNINAVMANNLAPEWEVIPSVSRTMNFTVTVRDVRNSLGSQSAFSDFKINVVETAPFRVTSQSENQIFWSSGEQHEITWDVAGTTGNGINTPNVTILLTTNGGQSFDSVLIASTPNDGSHTITVPSGIASQNARIMVKGVDNVFFALNQSPIAINVQCDDYTNTQQSTIPRNSTNITASITVDNQPGQLAGIQVFIDMSHTYVQDIAIELIHPNGKVVKLWENNCSFQDISPNGIIFDDTVGEIQCPSGETLGQEFAPVDKLSSLNGLTALGIWSLRFLNGNRRVGDLNGWSLQLCTNNGDTDLSTSYFQSLKGIKVYPNPNKGIFTADFGKNTAKKYQITLYDLLGRSVYQSDYTSAKNRINVQDLSKGHYLMVFETENGKAVSKIIIQ